MGKSPRLPFEIDKNGAIQKQLVDKLKEAIISMKLMPGQLLPSSRELASMYEIGRATAVRVYNDLIAQGYIETVDGRGTFVRKRLALEVSSSSSESSINLSELARHLMQLQPERLTAHDYPELNYGCCPADYLPLAQWKAALLECSRRLHPDDIEYGAQPFGYLPLRAAISEFLGRARTIHCKEDDLVLCSSSTYLLNLVAQLLLEPGQTVIFPEPGPMYARDMFHSIGANLVTVSVDADGLVIDEFEDLQGDHLVVYLNSSHHDPTGACFSMERRKALVNWADRRDALIIEDDYDPDFRYAAPPLPPLKTMSASVVYISNFWRTLFPLVNLSYMIVPEPLRQVVSRAWHLNQNTFHSHLPLLDQLAMVSFLNSGEYEKHIRRNHTIFAGRWRNCIHELTRNFGKSVEIATEGSTYHFFVGFKTKSKSEDLIRAASEAGLVLIDAAPFFKFDRKNSKQFLLPFAHMPEEQLTTAMRAFRYSLPD